MIKSTIIKLIFTLFFLTIVFLQSIQQPSLHFAASHLPYQAHSFNDLNITRNLMLKKVKYFKFDASLANRQSCAKHSTWDNKRPCYNMAQYAEQICCIALRGDAGSEPDFDFPFNTTEELVGLMSDFLKKYNQQIEILFFQLDIQFKFQFGNELIENTLYDLSILMKKYNKLHVTVDQNHILQYDRICRHYNSIHKTIAQDLNDDDDLRDEQVCTSKRKQISDSQIFLQSSSMNPFDSRDYKGRYRNFNTIATSIDHFCENGFPTWPNKYPHYPLIFWQPSNEETIQYALSKLLSVSCMRQHNRTVSGIALASNIQPQMFQIFIKKINQNPFSKQFPWNIFQNKIWFQNINTIKMTSIRQVNDDIKTLSKERLVIYSQSKQDNKQNHNLHILMQNDTNKWINLYKTIEISQGKIIELHSIKDKIIGIVRMDDGQSKQFEANILILNSKLQIIKTKTISNFISCYASNELIYYITRTSNPNYFNLYSINQQLTNPTQLFPSTYMSSIDTISSIYFKSGQTKSKDSLLVFSNDKQFSLVSLIIVGNIQKTKILTYGTNAHIIDKYDGNIVISVQNSYSHGGVLFNNNAQNKCYLHKVANSQKLAHIPNLINLLEGTYEHFINFINEDSNQIITGCHPTINFSKHLNGQHTSITSLWNQVILSSKYIPLHKQDLMMTLFSGGSNYQDTLRNKTGYIIVAANGNSRYRLQQNKQSIFVEK